MCFYWQLSDGPQANSSPSSKWNTSIESWVKGSLKSVFRKGKLSGHGG